MLLSKLILSLLTIKDVGLQIIYASYQLQDIYKTFD